MKVTQLCPTLCNPMDCSLSGFSVHGILQARILEWVAISFSGGSFQSRDRTLVSCIAGRFFSVWSSREAQGHLWSPSIFEILPLILGLLRLTFLTIIPGNSTMWLQSLPSTRQVTYLNSRNCIFLYRTRCFCPGASWFCWSTQWD